MLFDLSFVTTHSIAMVMSRRPHFTWARLKFDKKLQCKTTQLVKCILLVWFPFSCVGEILDGFLLNIFLTLPMHWKGFQRIKFRLFSSPTASLSTGTPTRHGWEQIAAHVRLCLNAHIFKLI